MTRPDLRKVRFVRNTILTVSIRQMPIRQITLPIQKEDQEINYTIAFGQTLAVNTQASDVFDSSIGRDIDELTDAVQMAITAHKKCQISKI